MHPNIWFINCLCDSAFLCLGIDHACREEIMEHYEACSQIQGYSIKKHIKIYSNQIHTVSRNKTSWGWLGCPRIMSLAICLFYLRLLGVILGHVWIFLTCCTVNLSSGFSFPPQSMHAYVSVAVNKLFIFAGGFFHFFQVFFSNLSYCKTLRCNLLIPYRGM